MSTRDDDLVLLPSGRIVTRRGFLKLFGASAAAAYLAACAPATPPAPATAPPAAAKPEPTKAPPKALEKVTIRLDWLVGGQHAPFFIAREKGYYKDAGLDVEILEAKGSTEVVQLVGTKNATFGNADGGSVIIGVAAGIPVKQVAGIVRATSLGYAFLKESGIKTPKDFEGKTFGQVVGSPLTTLWPAFAKANNIDVSKVKVVTIDPANADSLMLTGKIDFTSANAGAEEVRYTAAGKPGGFFGLADWSVNLVGHGIVAHNDTIKEKPNIVRGFVEASLKAWEEARKDPKTAVEILVKAAPDMQPARREQALGALQGVLPLLESPNTKGKALGWMSEKDWEETINAFSLSGALKAPVATKDVFTNEFVKA